MTNDSNCKQSKDVYVFLSGLFFLKYYGNTLLVTTPPVHDHEHRIGNPTPPESLTAWMEDIDWSHILVGGKMRIFPREILQFSRHTTKVGILQRAKGDLQIKLPVPKKIISLRIGNFADFPAVDGKVWHNMKQWTNGKLGLMTCLCYSLPKDKQNQWEWALQEKCHFYSEPGHVAGPEHLAMALDSSRKIFSKPHAFDLQIDTNAMPPFIRPIVPNLGHNFDEKDIQSLAELRRSAGGTNVANCGQIAVN